MKKIVLLSVAFLMVTGTLFSQNIFFSTKQGQKLLYATMKDNGKVDAYTSQTISKVTGSGKNISITYIGQILDKNKKPVKSNPEVTYTINVIDGVMELDMKSFATPGTEDLVTISGDKIRFPSTIKPGDKLEDVQMTLTISMGIKMTTDIAITQRACIAIEDVTVPAGKFKCIKLTETTSTTFMRQTSEMKMSSWYALGVGIVKTDMHDSKGKLISSQVLESITN